MCRMICAAVLSIWLLPFSSPTFKGNYISDITNYATSLQTYFNESGIDHRRIVGGNFVEIWDVPYHVGYGSYCSGTIIHERWVLTAAHCGYNSKVSYATKYFSGGRWNMVKRNIIHPGFHEYNKPHMFDYDFQLVELESRLWLDQNAQPIRLGRVADLRVGNYVLITGWGQTSEQEGTSSLELMAASVQVINTTICQEAKFPHYSGTLTDRMFCAGTKDQSKDACQGDSGGPAVVNNRLMGVISFGYGCATPGAYGVYANIISAKDWIRRTTGIYFE